jgi:hypothetical protein
MAPPSSTRHPHLQAARARPRPVFGAAHEPGDHFRDVRELSDFYPSVLCFEHSSTSRHDVQAQAGIKAIRAYLTSIYETRFIQSFKSHVASPIFDETRIFGRGYKFEDLLPVFFRHAIADADGQLTERGGRVFR